jgi:hypothetical protein
MVEINNFVKVADFPQDVIEKYQGNVPDEIIEFWKFYGLGSFAGGFLKVINPDEYQDILNESTGYFRDMVPIFATGLADLVVYGKGEGASKFGLYDVMYRFHDFDTMFNFEFFLKYYSDKFFQEKELKNTAYLQAVEKFGEPDYDQAFAFVPLLALGGSENRIDTMKKVNLKVHIMLITDLTGILAPE